MRIGLFIGSVHHTQARNRPTLTRRSSGMARTACAAALAAGLAVSSLSGTTAAQPPAPAATPPIGPRPMELLRAEAGRLLTHTRTESGQMFLLACSWLPIIDDREVYYDRAARRAATPAEFERLPEADRGGFEKVTLTEEFYYHTRYGSPLAYSRAIDLICAAEGDKRIGDNSVMAGRKLLDYGFGGIGHLRLLASLGIECVGVDVDPLLKAYYSDPADTGDIDGASIGGKDGPPGKLKLLFGKFPGEAAVRDGVGGGYDYVISKNTLKKGYVTPDVPIEDRHRVDLSVPPEEFVRTIASIMNPGGKFMIYNISPRQNPEKFIPWADGRCPFPREMLEKHGFRVIEFDRDDTEHVRKLGKALEWDIGPGAMNLDTDIFGLYTLLERLPDTPSPISPPPAPPPASDAPPR